jgi:hypothetical protein
MAYKVSSVETNKSAFTTVVVLVPIRSDIYSIVQAPHTCTLLNK